MALTKPAVDDFLGSITANKLELAFEQLEVAPSSVLAGQEAERDEHSFGVGHRGRQYQTQRRRDTLQSQR